MKHNTPLFLSLCATLLVACTGESENEQNSSATPQADMSQVSTSTSVVPSMDMANGPQDMNTASPVDMFGGEVDLSTKPEEDMSLGADMFMPPADMSTQTSPDMFMGVDMAQVDMAQADMGTSGPMLTSNVRNYIYGHSLILHKQDANVPMWLHALAQEAGGSYALSGQYGFADTHAKNTPPIGQWGVNGVQSIWDDDGNISFADVNFNTIMFTAANFRQYYPATQRDPDNILPESIVTSTTTVFDWVETQEPGIRYVIYENWPDMGGRTNANFTTTFPTAAELQAYHSFTQGSFHTWWVDYQDGMRAARPNLKIHLIPVGSIMAKLLTTSLSDVPAQDLYEDDAPHGKPTLYFLAGLITYMGLYGKPAPSSYTPPATINAKVRMRYRSLVTTIWNDLQNFKDPQGRNRVWGR